MYKIIIKSKSIARCIFSSLILYCRCFRPRRGSGRAGGRRDGSLSLVRKVESGPDPDGNAAQERSGRLRLPDRAARPLVAAPRGPDVWTATATRPPTLAVRGGATARPCAAASGRCGANATPRHICPERAGFGFNGGEKKGMNVLRAGSVPPRSRGVRGDRIDRFRRPQESGAGASCSVCKKKTSSTAPDGLSIWR